jgi:hypothetical protein
MFKFVFMLHGHEHEHGHGHGLATDMDLDTDVDLEMDANTDNMETDMYTYMSKKTALWSFQLILISLKIKIAKSVTFIEAIQLNHPR